MASKRPSPAERPEDKLTRNMGEVAREARKREGLTQAEVASRAGLAPGVYGRFERGGMMPSVQTLRQLSIVLKIPSDSLLGLSGSEVPPDEAVPVPGEDSPELERLARSLRKLSPSDLKVLNVVASALGR